LGTNGFTRDFSYFSGKNTLEKIEDATPNVIESFAYDNSGNQITAGTTRNYVWNAANQLITYYNQAGMADPSFVAVVLLRLPLTPLLWALRSMKKRQQ